MLPFTPDAFLLRLFLKIPLMGFYKDLCSHIILFKKKIIINSAKIQFTSNRGCIITNNLVFCIIDGYVFL